MASSHEGDRVMPHCRMAPAERTPIGRQQKSFRALAARHQQYSHQSCGNQAPSGKRSQRGVVSHLQCSGDFAVRPRPGAPL